jgi:hypothetical protein
MIVLASLVIAGVFVAVIPSAFSFVIINGVAVVHAQSIFPVPPPPPSHMFYSSPEQFSSDIPEAKANSFLLSSYMNLPIECTSDR